MRCAFIPIMDSHSPGAPRRREAIPVLVCFLTAERPMELELHTVSISRGLKDEEHTIQKHDFAYRKEDHDNTKQRSC